MRYLSLCVAAFFFLSAVSAEEARPRLLAVAISGDQTTATIQLSFSATTTYSVGIFPNHVDINLPAALWDAATPQRGVVGGLITSYRKEVAPRGTKISLSTPDEIKVDSTNFDEAGHLTIIISRPIIPPVIVDPDATGPLVIEGGGYPVIQSATPQAAAVQPAQKPVTQPICVPSTQRDGTVNGIPVYKFVDCNKSH